MPIWTSRFLLNVQCASQWPDSLVTQKYVRFLKITGIFAMLRLDVCKLVVFAMIYAAGYCNVMSYVKIP